MPPPLKFRVFPATRRDLRDVTGLMRLTPTWRWPFAHTLQLALPRHRIIVNSAADHCDRMSWTRLRRFGQGLIFHSSSISATSPSLPPQQIRTPPLASQLRSFERV